MDTLDGARIWVPDHRVRWTYSATEYYLDFMLDLYFFLSRNPTFLHAAWDEAWRHG